MHLARLAVFFFQQDSLEVAQKPSINSRTTEKKAKIDVFTDKLTGLHRLRCWYVEEPDLTQENCFCRTPLKML